MDGWIQLTEDNLDEALKLAGVSAFNKNDLKRTLAWHRCDTWLWDLVLRVGKKDRCVWLSVRMEEGWADGDGSGSGEWHIQPRPFGWDEGHISGLVRPKDDEEALGLLRAKATGFLQVILQRGLFERSDDDGDRAWRIRSKGKRREDIFFQSTEPRGVGLDGEDIPPERRWRILQDSDGWRQQKKEIEEIIRGP